jgi:hypothetical protein
VKLLAYSAPIGLGVLANTKIQFSANIKLDKCLKIEPKTLLNNNIEMNLAKK